MPWYDFKCQDPECEHVQEDMASIITYTDHHPVCEKCGHSMNYIFTISVPYVSFIDGVSGSWPSKGERFKKYRAQQSELAQKRQIDRHGPGLTLTPNFNGHETESWREAQSVAEREAGPEVAATYSEKVIKEKSTT